MFEYKFALRAEKVAIFAAKMATFSARNTKYYNIANVNSER